MNFSPFFSAQILVRKYISFFAVLCVSAVNIHSSLHGQVLLPNQNTQAKPASAAPKANDKVIARVMQTTITASQIEPDDETKKKAKEQLKDQYNKWLSEIKYVRLAAAIWEPIQMQFFKERGISASSAEVNDFFERSKQARQIQQRNMQQMLEQINQQMQSGKLSDAEKTQGQAIKKNLEANLSAMSKPIPEPTPQERQLAERIVQGWKFDQAVYKQYGGMVVMKQANPQEPIGAYKKFLEEHEKKKTFEIADASYKKKFWELFAVTNKAAIIPADKVDYSKPWWVLMVERGNQAGAQKK